VAIVDEEAARWFAALRRGVMPIGERAEYEAWLRKRENRDALITMDRLWSLLEGVTKAAPLSRRTCAILVAVIVVSTIAVAGISSLSHHQFWTTLDWTDR
jgi:ferric-dicitrate binding protein FerR (iron transport regulator)